MSDDRTALYRFYDTAGDLVYIGMSKNPLRRFGAHVAMEGWRQIAEIKIEWFATRTLALAAERAAIKSEKPAWNSVHTPRHKIVSLSHVTHSSWPETAAFLDDLLGWNERRPAE